MRKYQFKVETFSKEYPDLFIIKYRKRLQFLFITWYSCWSRLEYALTHNAANLRPSRDQPHFFASLTLAKNYVKKYFHTDKLLEDYLKEEDRKHKVNLAAYYSKRVVKVHYIE